MDDKDFVLLGIKYEAARLGGVDQAGLEKIEAQAQSEAGDLWASHPTVVRGRNAVRIEHGLSPLAEPTAPPASRAGRRPLWRRLLGG